MISMHIVVASTMLHFAVLYLDFSDFSILVSLDFPTNASIEGHDKIVLWFMLGRVVMALFSMAWCSVLDKLQIFSELVEISEVIIIGLRTTFRLWSLSSTERTMALLPFSFLMLSYVWLLDLNSRDSVCCWFLLREVYRLGSDEEWLCDDPGLEGKFGLFFKKRRGRTYTLIEGIKIWFFVAFFCNYLFIGLLYLFYWFYLLINLRLI